MPRSRDGPLWLGVDDCHALDQQAEADWLLKSGGYPDWDYNGIGDEGHPFEWSAGDWGWLDGKLVALDYAAPDEPPPTDDTNQRSERRFGR